MSLLSYLSDYVHKIVVEYGKQFNKCTRSFVCNDITYNWSNIEVVLGEITDDFDILDQSEEWYLEKSLLVWDVLHEAGLVLSNVSNEERETLNELCRWVDVQSDLIQHVGHCRNEDEDANLLAILVMTAAIERALGNVYMKKRYPVPFLLRDLLKAPELMSIFGKVPLVFTQLLVGCPRGFNIRNVAWHGFLSPGELHPHLVSGLTVLVASLGKLLQDQEVPKRPQISSFEMFEEDLSNVFPNITNRHDEVHEMIEKSLVVPENSKIFWNKAYDMLQAERFGYSLVLIMPQLEHCLRVLYCGVNDCPARLLTAESTEFYTTLDEILAPSQSAVVSSGLLMVLLDVTSSLTGPRLRDRLSHGEIQLEGVPRWLINFIFCVTLATAHSFHQEDKSDNIKHCNISLCSLLEEATSHYRSKFHIVASVRRQLTSLLEQWLCWQNCPTPSDVDVKPASCQLIHSLDQLMFPCGGDITERLSRVNAIYKGCDLPTLYRPKLELELAAGLGVVVSHVKRTAEKVCHAAMSRHQLWCERGLRSRGRATALRMWSVLPDVWMSLLCVVMMVTLCYRQLPNLATKGKPVFRLVKVLTKTVENTVTLCDVDNNRWIEAHQILSDTAASCLQFFTDNSDLVNKN